MANRVVEQFDKNIQILEARVTAMKAIREALAQDPEFVTVIQGILLDPSSNGKPAPERAFVSHDPVVLNYEKIIHVLLSKGNEWRSIREISKMAKVTRGAINNVLYSGGQTHLFEEQKVNKRDVVWRVNPKAATMPGFPESCVPLIKSLYSDGADPATLAVEPKKVEAEAAPNVIPIRTPSTQAAPKPKPKYAPARG
ncbi:MAG: hypothetical protein K2X38_15250 [Gemmataceae bacterium]|nr:hypothetical protein [Gemmataceae bacterium]